MITRILFLIIMLIANSLYAQNESRYIVVEGDNFSGTKSEYISALRDCKNSGSEVTRGEYESKDEFEQRKKNSKTNCLSMEDVKITAPWNLQYNADRQRFVVNLSQAFGNIKIENFVTVTGSRNPPRRGYIPMECQNGFNRPGYYQCKITQQGQCANPYFELSSVVNKIDIDSKCWHKYTKSGWTSDWEYHEAVIKFENMAIFVSLEEARKLKSHEQTLFFELDGKFDGETIAVDSFVIIDKSNGAILAKWQR